MSAERWEEVSDALAEAQALEPSERRTYLDEMDPHVRGEVEALLPHAAKAESEGFLKDPPWIVDDIPLVLEDFGVLGEEPRYTKIQYVGHGGMGVVYKAFDANLKRWVALKITRPGASLTREDVKRFRTEAQHQANLKHSYIVPVHEVGIHADGRPYFTMDFIEGCSLNDRLSEFTHDHRAAAYLVKKLALAVHHAHTRRLQHGDLKPDNILLDDEQRPYVTDFGLAKPFEKDEKIPATGNVEGTIGFMSPEQTEPNLDLTTTSDVHGLGAVLFAILTGKAPYRVESPDESWADPQTLVRNRIPEFPKALHGRCDPDLERTCLKCLEKNPEERYGSAEAVARDLQRWLDLKKPRAVPRWPVWKHVWRWSRRNPAAAVFTVVALSLSGVGGKTWLDKRNAEITVSAQKRATLESCEYVAGLVASILHNRLEKLKAVVNEAAGSDKLRVMLRSDDVDGLHAFLKNLAKSRLGLEGYRPFETSAIYDAKGKMLEQSMDQEDREEPLLGKNFLFRDYIQGALARASEPGVQAVYVSRLYFSKAQKIYKFGIDRVVQSEEGEIIGVIHASITTGRTMGLEQIKDSRYKVAVVGLWDPNPARGEPKQPAEYLIVLHPTFEPRACPVPFPKDQAHMLSGGAFEDYRDPVGQENSAHAGRWLAGFAKVPGTRFCVIVQVREADRMVPP